jgi:hypothetical protein
MEKDLSGIFSAQPLHHRPRAADNAAVSSDPQTVSTSSAGQACEATREVFHQREPTDVTATMAGGFVWPPSMTEGQSRSRDWPSDQRRGGGI